MNKFSTMAFILGGLVIFLEFFFFFKIDNAISIVSIIVLFVTTLVFAVLGILMLNPTTQKKWFGSVKPLYLTVKSNLLPAPVISILVAGISGYIGFNMTQFLSRDNVSIQDISIKHAEIRIGLTPEAKYALSNLKTDNSFYSSTLTLRNLGIENDDFSEKSIISILKYYNNAMNNINIKINEQLQLLPKIKTSQKTKKDSLKMLTPYINDDDDYSEGIGTPGNDANQEKVRNRISLYNSLNNKIDSVFKIIIPEIIKQVNEHKNDYQIDVILYNSGEKQAVVKYMGKLDLGDRQIELSKKKSYSQTDDYTDKLASAITSKWDNSLPAQYIYIQPKSFNGLSLIVNESKNPRNDIEYSKNILLTRSKVARLIVTDISGSKKIFKDLDFQLDSQDDLADYLRKEFNKYIPSSL